VIGATSSSEWHPHLLPFMKAVQLTWSGQWALNARPNFVVTAVLIGIALTDKSVG